jgi:hypothetical protein
MGCFEVERMLVMTDQPMITSGAGGASDDAARTAAPNPELESLATSVELTLASVLQGIALAILVPKIVDLITSGALAKLPYIPASLLLLFMVWVTFIGHALSFVTWPFDPLHNMLYFLIVTSEAVLLFFLDQPAQWFLSLFGFGLVLGFSFWYNQRLLERNARHYTSAAARRLYAHIMGEQRAGLRFMAGYCVIGLIGVVGLQLRPELGLAQELGWVVTGFGAIVLPLIHVLWQSRVMTRRAQLIEQAKADPATL